MKIFKYFLISLAAIVGLFLIGFIMTTCLSVKEENCDELINNYPALTDTSNVYEVIDAPTCLELIKNDAKCLIVFAFPSCPWCQQLIPFLNQVAKETNYEKIYYLDIKEIRDNEDSSYHLTYLEIAEQLNKALDKEKNRMNAPTVVALNNGEVVGYHLDTVSSHQIVDGILPPMTDKQKAELKEKLVRLINLVK